MMDITLNQSILIGIWALAGLIALIPLFIKLNWKKYLVVPLIFFTVYVSFITNEEFLGTPIYDFPKGEFAYVWHTVTNIDNEKTITLWIRQDDKYRLYSFPYIKAAREALKRAKKAKKNGKTMQGHFKRKRKDPTDDTPTTLLHLYDFPYQKVFPKD